MGRLEKKRETFRRRRVIQILSVFTLHGEVTVACEGHHVVVRRTILMFQVNRGVICMSLRLFWMV